MRKRIHIPVAIMMIAAIVLVFGCAPTPTPPPSGEGPAPEAPKVITLKLQSVSTPAELYRNERFSEEVKSLSNGRIEIKNFSSGEIVPTVEVLDAVSKGVLDMACHSGGLCMDILPIGAVEFGLPFSWKDPGLDVYVIFWERGLIDLVREAYAEHGVYYLGPIHTDPYALIATKECHTIADLQELKIRTAGGVAKVLGSLNIPTVFIPIEESYTALATGIIDGAIWGGASGYRDMKYYEVAKYYYKPPVMACPVCNHIINMDVWNSLPSDLQAILEYATSDFSQWMAFNFMDLEYKAIESMRKDYGLKVVTLPDETVAELTEAALSYWDEVATKSPRCAKGVEIVKDWMRITGRIK